MSPTMKALGWYFILEIVKFFNNPNESFVYYDAYFKEYLDCGDYEYERDNKAEFKGAFNPLDDDAYWHFLVVCVYG